MQAGSEQFTYNGCSMDTSYQLRARVIIVVVLQQELPGFLIQCGFGIRIDQQALDRHEYMTNAKGRLPVLLQSVDANLTGGGDVWVENLGGEPT